MASVTVVDRCPHFNRTLKYYERKQCERAPLLQAIDTTVATEPFSETAGLTYVFFILETSLPLLIYISYCKSSPRICQELFH